MTRDLEVKFVVPKIWEQCMNRDFATLRLSPKSRALAQSILTLCHERGVGITPYLAGGAALLMNLDGEHDLVPPWRAVNDRLQNAFETLRIAEKLGGPKSTPEFRETLWSKAVPLPFFLFRLVIPLILEACHQLEPPESWIMSNTKRGGSAKDYDCYTKKLYAAVEAFAVNPEDRIPQKQSNRGRCQQCRRENSAMCDKLFNSLLKQQTGLTDVFWVDRLLALMGISPHSIRSTSKHASYTFLADTSVFSRLEPTIGEGEEQQWSHLELPRLERETNKLLKDPGFDGVKKTRRIEDLPHILKSEFIFPEELLKIHLVDRLFNTGFMALKPPEPPLQLRDVLIVGLVPPEVSKQPSIGFLKTCWFDFLMRMGQLLYKSDLPNSEFRWIEGDTFERVRPESMLVYNLPRYLDHLSLTEISQQRCQLAVAMRWWPSYFDRHAEFATLPHLSKATLKDIDKEARIIAAKSWLGNAWKTQRELSDWSKPEKFSHWLHSQPYFSTYLSQALDFDQYLFIQIVLCLPSSWAKDFKEAPAFMSYKEWEHLFRNSRAHVGVLWVPDQIDQPPGWHYSAARGEDIRPLTEFKKDEMPSYEDLAHMIIDWLQNSVLEELCYV